MTISFLKVALLTGACLALSNEPAAASSEAYDQLTNWAELPERNIGRTPPNWVKNTRFNEGEGVLISKGEERELSLKTPSGTEHPFHLYFREHFAIPQSGTITITLEASGRGSIGAFCYLYDEQGGALGMSPRDGDGMQSVESQETVTLKYEVNLTAEAVRRGHPTSLRFALVVGSDSDITVKSIQVKAD